MVGDDGRASLDAWLRAVFSETGPRPTVRLVLAAIARFMDFERPRTFVGVRRLADATGLNKDTVCQAIAEADRDGWLVLESHARGAPRRFMCAQIPPRDVSEQAGHSATQEMSEQAGHSSTPPVRVLSESNGSTVRNDGSDCPSRSDRPSSTLLDHRPACAREDWKQEQIERAVAQKLAAGVGHIDKIVEGLPSDLRAYRGDLRALVWRTMKRLRSQEAARA